MLPFSILVRLRVYSRNQSFYNYSKNTNATKECRLETTDQTRARLLYQSRKRGMLENGLLFSTFVDKHLNTLTADQIRQYDKLINEPSNDWDIYYWLTGKVEPPDEFRNEVFEMLKEHTQNKFKEQRYRQPDLYS